MKREMFRRGVRMTHRYGALEEDGPFMDGQTFDPGFPRFPRQHSRPLTIQQDGDYRYSEVLSPIVKAEPNKESSKASLSGPKPDMVDCVSMEIPASTQKRTPLKPTGK